jgi:hypothetical protein
VQFEDLSNEIIHEIFEYLDDYHIYKSFFNLNTRLQNLLINSTIPIQINISTLSKSTFEHYYTDFILPNKHRIKSLELSNPFAINFFFQSAPEILKYSRLETLIFYQIEENCLGNLLRNLITLPKLSSLVIPLNTNTNIDILYNLIIQLPNLKYCKLFVDNIERRQYFSFVHITIPLASSSTKTFSPIEHLVINDQCNIDQIGLLLSYLPKLRRLSVNYLCGCYRNKTKISSNTLNDLTHVSLTISCPVFADFEQLVKNHFRQVKVLRITTANYITYLDADQWEQLISSHMPYLQIFDFQYRNLGVYYDGDQNTYLPLLKKFNSPFWFERRWFFVYDSNSGIYSTEPYR